MAGKPARREEGAMPLRIVTDEATPPDAPPRPCPRGLRRLSPAAASRRLGQYRRGYSRFACSLHQTNIIRNATPSGFGIDSSCGVSRNAKLLPSCRETTGMGRVSAAMPRLGKLARSTLFCSEEPRNYQDYPCESRDKQGKRHCNRMSAVEMGR